MSVRLSRYSDSRIHGMYSKHSALGSRMLGIIQNNDVTSSSPRGLFQNNKQNGYHRRPSAGHQVLSNKLFKCVRRKAKMAAKL